MSINRGRKSTGGEHLTQPPTFTESLLMEILVQSIPVESSYAYYSMILTRAGFTEAEIKERLNRS